MVERDPASKTGKRWGLTPNSSLLTPVCTLWPKHTCAPETSSPPHTIKQANELCTRVGAQWYPAEELLLSSSAVVDCAWDPVWGVVCPLLLLTPSLALFFSCSRSVALHLWKKKGDWVPCQLQLWPLVPQNSESGLVSRWGLSLVFYLTAQLASGHYRYLRCINCCLIDIWLFWSSLQHS